MSDPGYFFTPHVPLTSTPVVLSPDFIPRREILTRYGKKLLREDALFYKREIKSPKEYRSIDEPFEVSYSE